MLWLHGAGGIDAWTPWMDALAATHDLIVPDHPGWGESATPAWFDNIHDLAYFYLDFIAALGLPRVDLVGHSMGGWIACEIAVRNTASLRSLTLVAPAGLRVAGAPPFDIFLAAPEALARAAFHDQAFAEGLSAVPVTPERLDARLRNQYAAARAGWQPRLYDPHLAKWLHRVDVPTLVVWGENDGILPVAMQPEFVRLIPGARAATIPQCGHIPHVERTAAFLDCVLPFVAGAGA